MNNHSYRPAPITISDSEFEAAKADWQGYFQYKQRDMKKSPPVISTEFWLRYLPGWIWHVRTDTFVNKRNFEAWINEHLNNNVTEFPLPYERRYAFCFNMNLVLEYSKSFAKSEERAEYLKWVKSELGQKVEAPLSQELGEELQGEINGKENPIQWNTTHSLLVYLLKQLQEQGYISNASPVATIISKHFMQQNGKKFKNSSQTEQNVMATKRVRGGNKIAEILSKMKNK